MLLPKKFFQIILIPIFMLGLVGTAAAVPETSAHIHGPLYDLAQDSPGQTASVIVQKTVDDGSVESRAEQLGGKVTRDLPIINAFTVEMSAGSALKLSQYPGVRWVSLDARVEQASEPPPPPTPTSNSYLQTLGVPLVWSMGIDGSGIGVAVIDSGISPTTDLSVVKDVTFNPNSNHKHDNYGHGSHVAGIVAGDGDVSNGKFKGVAPGAHLINLKVCDDSGVGYESDVVAAMQWIYDNKVQYNIRVVNISLNSSQEQSYHTSPVAAAAEILWFNGVVVVVSSGNTGGSDYNVANAAPANDPFFITVGAADELATADSADDVVADFTAWTVTLDNYLKPDIFAPGRDIISILSNKSDWDLMYPERVVDYNYFRLSGTSMAAPMVSGAVALLLEDEPNLNPDQVKYRLLHATNRSLSIQVNNDLSYDFPYLDVYAAVTGTTTETSNTGQAASQLLWTGDSPVSWGSVNWGSVNWGSVNWGSVNWGSVNWGSVNWGSVSWDN